MSLPASKTMQFVRIPPQGMGVDAEEQWVTFSDLLRILRINWLKILVVSLIAAVIGVVVVAFMPPVYVGTALVMVDEQQSRVFKDQSDGSVLSSLPADPSSVESQVTVIQSHALAAQVVDQLKLWDNPGFNGLGGKLEADENVVDGMSREIREEAGINCEQINLAGTISWPGFGKQGEDWFGFVFRITRFSGTPLTSNAEGTLEWVDVDRVLTLPLWEGDRFFLPLVFDLSSPQFHGVMPYKGGKPVSWDYRTIF